MDEDFTFFNLTRPAGSADEAREIAIEWQHWQAEQSMSWGEVAAWMDYFEALAERFPELTDEFKENGII